jgi:small subunit ribosomal protein S1
VQALQELKRGQIIKGKVTRLVNFGAFVELKPGVEGLVHVSQIADYHVKHPSEALREGEEIDVKILDVKPEAKRISLSIKEAAGKREMQNGPAPGNASNGGFTVGDYLGGFFEEKEEEPAAPDEPGAVTEEDQE